MIITYTPQEGEVRTWEFTPQLLMTPEAEAIESVGGTLWEDFDTFGQLFNKGNRRAYRAALWVLLRREDPSLRFETLSVGAMDIKLTLGEFERERIRAVLTQGDRIDPEQRRFFIDMLGEDPEEVGGPKDPEPSG